MLKYGGGGNTIIASIELYVLCRINTGQHACLDLASFPGLHTQLLSLACCIRKALFILQVTKAGHESHGNDHGLFGFMYGQARPHVGLCLYSL